MPKFFLNLFFIFLFIFSFFQKVSALECRYSPGGYCTYSVSDCTDNGGYVDSSYECLGESTGNYCCFPGSEKTPTPTPKKTTNTCEDNGGTCVSSDTVCNKILQYSCGEKGGICCDTGKKDGSGAWEKGLKTANQSANLPDTEIESVAENILTYTLSLFILFGVLFFVITGLKYIIAGSTGNAEKSKLGIQHLIIGITIGLSGYIIIKFINYILGG